MLRNIIHANLPPKYCEYALLDAVYKYSKLLHTSSSTAPYTKWHNTPILRHRLLPFGVQGHAHVHRKMKRKLSHRSTETRLVLYMPHDHLILKEYNGKIHHVYNRDFQVYSPALDRSPQHVFSKTISQHQAFRCDGVNQTEMYHAPNHYHHQIPIDFCTAKL